MTDPSPPPLAERFRAASGALGIATALVGAGATFFFALPRGEDVGTA